MSNVSNVSAVSAAMLPSPADALLATEPDALAPAAHTFTGITEADAVEIWIARWLRIPLKSLIARYRCDSRRLYEIWWSERHPGSRARAEIEFRRRYPALADRTSYGYRRIPRVHASAAQLGLFK